MSKKKAYVIGAGFSGLSLSYYLSLEGYEVEVFEKDRRVGGLIQTKKLRFGIAESAANAFINSLELETLAKKIGVELRGVTAAAKNRYIWRSGSPKRWPLTFAETLFLLLRLLVLPFRDGPKALETLNSWGYRALGRVATDKLLSAALQGIYAGDPSRMSARLIVLKLWESFRSRKKLPPPLLRGSVAPADGMNSFLSKLAEYLQNQGVRVHLNSELNAVSFSALYNQARQESARLFLCTPPGAAGDLLSQLMPKEAALLNQVEMQAVLSATMIYPKGTKSIDGFGCLFPRQEGIRALGVLINSNIFENRAEGHSETWIYSDDFRSETEALDCIRRERKQLMGEEVTPLEFKVTRWVHGIPHYSVHLEAILNKGIEANLWNKNIVLHGNYLGALGLTKILDRSHKLAKSHQGPDRSVSNV